MSALLQCVGRDLINPPFFHLLFCSLPMDADIDGISGVCFGLRLCFLGSLGMPFFLKKENNNYCIPSVWPCDYDPVSALWVQINSPRPILKTGRLWKEMKQQVHPGRGREWRSEALHRAHLKGDWSPGDLLLTFSVPWPTMWEGVAYLKNLCLPPPP